MDYSFNQKMEEGKIGENIFQNAFWGWDFIGDTPEGIANDIDFRSQYWGGQPTCEVKYDIMSDNTGNLYVESGSNNNPSREYKGWLHYCQAEYIAFIQPKAEKIHVFKTAQLRKMCLGGEVIPERHFWGYNAAYLLPVADLDSLPIIHQTYDIPPLGKKEWFEYI